MTTAALDNLGFPSLLIEVQLGFSYLHYQKWIMGILYEIFQLDEPDWTDDFDKALLSIGKYCLPTPRDQLSFYVIMLVSRCGQICHCNSLLVMKERFTCRELAVLVIIT